MPDERPGPSLDRVREQLHRSDPPEPDHEPGEGPDPDRVTEVRERVDRPADGED